MVCRNEICVVEKEFCAVGQVVRTYNIERIEKEGTALYIKALMLCMTAKSASKRSRGKMTLKDGDLLP